MGGYLCFNQLLSFSWRMASATAFLFVITCLSRLCFVVKYLKGVQQGHGPCVTCSRSLFTCASRLLAVEYVLSHCLHLCSVLCR